MSSITLGNLLAANQFSMNNEMEIMAFSPTTIYGAT
jgi:hypothetical protein